jgi:hypothetical protein
MQLELGSARHWRLVGLLLGALLIGACAQTRPTRMAGVAADAGLARGAEVLVVEPDIELSELLANGVQELRADWTLAAREHVDAALAAALAEHQSHTRRYTPADDPDLAAAQRQIVLLNEAVGTSILIHRYFDVTLAHKGSSFDWSLGPGARQLDPNARYALFVFLRDSYATTGRKAMLALSLIGVGVSLGQQLGFASLVDLDSGKVVWFNLLQSQSGDLRNAHDARIAIDQLLDGAPL